MKRSTKCTASYLVTIILLVTQLTSSLHAQRRETQSRFSAGIVAGLTTSQVNGDRYSGFNKFGGFAGLRATMRITRVNELGVEILYNRKGSKNPDQPVPGQGNRYIELDYVEVPIFYRRKIETKNGARSFEIGIAYARLFGVRINERVSGADYAPFTNVQDDFKNSELALVLGGGISINEHIQLLGRFTPSLSSFYKTDKPESILTSSGVIPGISRLINLQLTLGVNYIF